jgi:hypothetical protein
MGVAVTGEFIPGNPHPTTGDTFMILDATYMLDGFRNVASTSDRNLITTPRRKEGMVVGVQADESYWRLNSEPWLGDDSDWTEWSLGVSGLTLWQLDDVYEGVSGSSYQDVLYFSGGTWYSSSLADLMGDLSFTQLTGDTIRMVSANPDGTLTDVDEFLWKSIQTTLGVGTQNVDTFASTGFCAAQWVYSVRSGSTNMRGGTVNAVWDETQIEFNEASTVDIGNTDDVWMECNNDGTNIELNARIIAGIWDVKVARLKV